MSSFAAVSNGSTTSPYFDVQQVPKIESVPKDKILVKTVAFAVNPTDWKHLAWGIAQKGAIVGCDFSGVVEEVGSEVTGFEKGDYIGGWVHGNFKPGQGSFQNYVLAEPYASFKFNKSIFTDSALPVGSSPLSVANTFEGAASLPLGLTTVGLSFSINLNLKADDASNKDAYILIWGGATATGIIAIQVAKLIYGLKVITTASSKNVEFLKSLGADHVVNYNDKDATEQIKKITTGNIKYVFDTVASKQTLQSCYDATADSKSVTIDDLLFEDQSTLDLDPARSESVKFTKTLGYVVFGETITYLGPVFDQPAEFEEKYVYFWKHLAPKFVDQAKTARLRVLKSGLESATEALALLKEDKVSGEKVVFRA